MRTDDGLMVFALATFTVMTYGINGLLNRGAETAFVAEEVLQLMTKEDVSLLIRNAKWIYAICHLEILTLWSAKFCMVIIYLRIT